MHHDLLSILSLRPPHQSLIIAAVTYVSIDMVLVRLADDSSSLIWIETSARPYTVASAAIDAFPPPIQLLV